MQTLLDRARPVNEIAAIKNVHTCGKKSVHALPLCLENIHKLSSYHRKTSELVTCEFRCRLTHVITLLWNYSLMKAIDMTLTYVKLTEKPFKPGFRTLAIHDCE